LGVAKIAALAGVERTSVQNALRAAQRLGLILVEERRIPSQKSRTNVVTLIPKDWSLPEVYNGGVTRGG